MLTLTDQLLSVEYNLQRSVQLVGYCSLVHLPKALGLKNIGILQGNVQAFLTNEAEGQLVTTMSLHNASHSPQLILPLVISYYELNEKN